MKKKYALLIYPYFSMQEISCLTAALSVWHEYEMDVFYSKKESVKSEEGFIVTANKILSEFNPDDYMCLILPGIINPLPALFDEEIIAFLKTLKNKEILISAISSSPILLAKAGLLENICFTSGIWDEILRHHDFIPYENVLHKPLVHDKNIITASGFAFREFAEQTLKTLDIDDCESGIYKGVYKDFSEEEMTYKMGKENFGFWLKEYSQYAEKTKSPSS